MKEGQFKAYLLAADALGGDYADGYRRGLRRFRHGEQFSSEEEHRRWSAAGLDGDGRIDLGDGYREGAAGKPPRGMHGNLGNLNAQGVLPADSQLQVRVNSQVKARWVKQAQREGLKLSQWVHKTLDKACNGDD